MADPIGTLQIYGDQALQIFNKTSPGSTLSLRVCGTVQAMSVPTRDPRFPYPNHLGTAVLIVEIEKVDR